LSGHPAITGAASDRNSRLHGNGLSLISTAAGMEAGGRLGRLGPVAITSPKDLHPGRGWTIKQALALLTQGYSVDHAVQVTGYTRCWVAAHAVRLTTPPDHRPVTTTFDRPT